MALITPHTFAFLRGLKRHNRRDWFEAHRADYERHVREPMRALVDEMDLRLARFAPEIIGDPRRSIFRIHRDTRFSKDKSPYKTHASCWFFHGNAGRRVGREADDGSAGFYVQIAPGDSFLGGGFWRPPRGTLARFRAAIAESPKVFQRLATSRVLARRFGGLDREDMLKRMPRGYSEDHPAAEWLRLQSFTVGRALSDAEALSSRLPAKLESDFVAILPLVRWLNSAIDCAPLRRR